MMTRMIFTVRRDEGDSWCHGSYEIIPPNCGVYLHLLIYSFIQYGSQMIQNTYDWPL